MSTSVSSVVSHFPDCENGFTTTTAGSVSSGAVTVTLNSVAGYTNGMPVVLVIDPTDAAKKQTFTGIVDTAGVQITDVVWTAGTNQTHALGATVVDYATATHIAMMSKGILVDHSQTGGHEIATNYDPSNPTLETQKWVGVASAVNEITVTNAATGNFPTISATGEADTGIDFENSEGEEILKLDAVASAVNEVTITNAATTAYPSISATGGDTNIDISLVPKGTGDLLIKNYAARKGWFVVSETWTYASPTTITVPSGAASWYSIGDKLTMTNSGTKQFYITAVADTLLTVTGGSDFTVANAAISAIYHSKAVSPVGFPQWFSWTPTLSGRFNDSKWTKACKFTMTGKTVVCKLSLTANAATPMDGGTTDAFLTFPVTSAALANTGNIQVLGTVNAFITSIYPLYVGLASTTTALLRPWLANATHVVATLTDSTTPASWASGSEIGGVFSYEAA